jgi:DNA-binding beta-propeller fold protein YncE
MRRTPVFFAVLGLSIAAISARAQTATYIDNFIMPAPDAMPSYPYGLCLDDAGLVYVTDNQFTHSRVVRFSATGAYDGAFGSKGTGNGQFQNPDGIAVNSAANRVYVCDTTNNRLEIFDTSGGWISTLTNPNGNAGYQISLPVGVGILSTSGDVYFGDAFNRVQRLSTEGLYEGEWGKNGSGNGQFGFFGAIGIASNPTTGQTYVVDYSNHRVQRFNSGGVFELKFGSNGSGDGQFNGPRFVAVDAAGHVYVTDVGNNRVERFSADGVFELAFGTMGAGDGQFNTPQGIAVSSSGIVYVADSFNGRIQRWQITEALPPAPGLTVTGKKKLTVKAAKVVLKGTATGSVTSVTYTIGKKKGTASGTGAWKIIAALKPGKNKVIIVAHGPGGNSTAVTVVVKRK